ncbi:MAG: putative Ig domain-containing protein [Candidatus Bipolaricaulota bacterium]|nr:putative Ig domain-containing protein [Candidatus Bipolaricaulota bacterium]
MQLSLSSLPHGGMFILGEPIRLYVSSVPSWVRYRLTDAYGPAFWTANGDVFEGDGLVQPSGSGAWLVLPTDRITRYGFYRLEVFTNQGNLHDLFIGLVDPVIPLGADNSSPVGFIIAIDDYQGFAEQIARLGIKWVHFDIPVNTENDVLTALDPPVPGFVAQALANDVVPVFKLIGGAPPGADNYNSAFYQNLRTVAQAYAGQVRYWIVGNEIDGCGWWNPCDPSLYVTFLRGVAQVIRSVEPNARILAADLYQGDSQVLQQMLAEEQSDPSFTLFDVLSVHYLEEGNGQALSPDGCCGSIETYSQVMQQYGVSKPIWNTEALSPLRGGLHWFQNETSYFRGGQTVPLLSPAKTVVGNLAVGAKKIFFFSYNYDQQLLSTLENPARTLTERALAVRALADHLQTATYLSRLPNTPSFVEGHFFTNGSETVLVIWSNESGQDIEASMSVNGSATLFDPLGNAYPLRVHNGQVKFRVHYEPQYIRGFTNTPALSFGASANDAPYFVSKPITTAKVGRSYYYNAHAYDPDPTGELHALVPVTYTLVQGPSGMQVDGTSGVVTWTPTQAGQFAVTLRVQDSQGASATQSFTITVVSSSQNAAPQILSEPRTTFGVVGIPWAYNVNAFDPEGDSMTYELLQAPPWLSINASTGFIYGIPSQAGTVQVTVRARDSSGAFENQTFALTVAQGSVGPSSGSYSLRFYGNGVNDIDRVKIQIDPHKPADVGATDFTIEFWMKANSGENTGTVTCNTNDGWITGNIIIDRDIWGPGDYGDFGISLNNGKIAFGVSYGNSGNTICGNISVTNGQWHHVAVTRQYSTGQLCIFVNGQQDVCGPGNVGSNRDVSYRDGRSTSYPNSDPFLVLGAEKHDAGPAYPSYKGWLDELRISNVRRYTGNFTPPSVPFTPDANTVALYHFDEGSGNTINDSSGASGGPSNGVRKYGGSPAGPEWSTDTPFASNNTPALFRVERATGNVYADGAFLAGGADVAEYVLVSEAVEPGDVVEIDPENPKRYRKARAPYSRLIAGVISLKPGLILNASGDRDSQALLALAGQVWVKATTENGPIRPGDLLTSASKPGYAMRCESAQTCEGALLGKALTALDQQLGAVRMILAR